MSGKDPLAGDIGAAMTSLAFPLTATVSRPAMAGPTGFQALVSVGPIGLHPKIPLDYLAAPLRGGASLMMNGSQEFFQHVRVSKLVGSTIMAVMQAGDDGEDRYVVLR